MKKINKIIDIALYDEDYLSSMAESDLSRDIVIERVWKKVCIRFGIGSFLLLTVLFTNLFVYIRYTYEFYTIKLIFILFIAVILFLLVYIIMYSILNLRKLKHFKRCIKGNSSSTYNSDSRLSIINKASLYIIPFLLFITIFIMYYAVKNGYYNNNKYKPVKYVSVTEIPQYAKCLTLEELNLLSEETSIIKYPTNDYIKTYYRLNQKNNKANKENDFELIYSVSKNEFISREIYKNIGNIKDDTFTLSPKANWVEIDKEGCKRLSIQEGRYFIGKKYLILVARGKRDNFMLYVKGVDEITEDLGKAIANR